MAAPAPADSRLSPYHRWLFFFLGVAGFFEGYDNFAFAQVLPTLRAEWGLSRAEAGWLVGVTNIGTMLAFVLVRAADTWGRRRVLTITILGYTASTLLTGLAPNVWAFAVAQLLARIFLIAEWAIGTVYAAEEFPAERRGTMIGVIHGLNGLGAVVCAGVAPLIVKLPLGWRGVYFVGAVPLLLMAVARRSIRETRRFSEHAAARGSAPRPFTRILKPPYLGRMLLLALLWALTYACTNASITFWKEHAVGERGMADTAAGTSIAIAAVAAMPLAFASGKLLDRFGRRVGAVVIYLATVLGVIGAYTLEARWMVITSLVLGIAGVTSVGVLLAAYTAELFPTDLRGDAFGWSNHLLGRVTLVLSPPLVGYAAEQVGWSRAVSATTLFPAVALVLLLAVLPETRGRELEETSGQKGGP